MAKKDSYGGSIADRRARRKARKEANMSDNTDSLGKRRRKRRKRKKRENDQDTSSILKTSRIKRRIKKSVSKLTKVVPNSQGKLINSFNTFGKPEDNIELNIYDNTNTLVAHLRDFKDYTFTEEGKTPEGLSNEVVVDPVTNLRNLNFNSGQFTLEYRFQRRKMVNTFKKVFFIKEISNSRREIRIDNNDLNNLELQQRYNIFKGELDDSSTFKDFTLNFGEGVNITAVNIFLDKSGDDNSLLIKLLDPLPLTIANSFTLRIVEDLIEPARIDINLESLPVEDDTIFIAGPNFKIDTRLNSSTPSEFKTYDELLNGGITSSYENVINSLSSSFEPSVEYDNLITDSGYHFENFVHFSRATERLNNFKYKLKLLELYDSQITNIDTITGNASSSVVVLDSKDVIRTKKKKVIGGFDGYERFLYYESGAYSWPKSNSTKPYTQYAISTSNALTWFGSNDGASDYYGGQIYSASQFDDQNVYNLNKLIPEYIKNDSNNNQYNLFVDMIGQHFDQSWLYIKSLTENKRAENKLNRGIDKDLVYNALKGLGIQVFDEFENEDLFGYLTGINKDGSLLHQTSSGITLVTASNNGSLPKADITKEKWKRIYHNLPYLLKTKGTERGVRALITSYGIPSTILNVKEFGGSTPETLSQSLSIGGTPSSFKTFTHDKFSYHLNGYAEVTSSYAIKTLWSSSLTDALSASAKTIETQFKLDPYGTAAQDTHELFTISGSDTGSMLSLLAQPLGTGVDVHELGDNTQYGRLTLYQDSGIIGSTEYFPIFNGKFWTIFMGTEGTSGSSAGVQFGAYQANHLKNIQKYVTQSSHITEAERALSFGDPYSASGAFIGGASHVYIGGVPIGHVGGSQFSGSLREIRYYFGELLNDSTLQKHALVPSMYSGNSFSSSFSNLVLRLPLGSNLQQDSQSYHPNSDVRYLNPEPLAVFEFTVRNSWSSGEELTIRSAQGNTYNFKTIINGTHLNITSDPGDFDGEDFMQVSQSGTSFKRARGYQEAFEEYFGDEITVVRSGRKLTLTQTIAGASGLTLVTTGSGNTVINDDADTGLSFPTSFSFSQSLHPINSNLTSSQFISSTETHHLTTPDTVGKSMTSEKVRLDSGEVEDNILSPDIKTETSVLDRQPAESHDLGVYFSPSNEINKDIIYQLGSFRLDDYIGDPTHISEDKYPDLKTLSNEYFKKPMDRFKYTDFIDITKQFDHTLFKMIESMVPAKANLKTGILIEPHYLERSKFGNPSTLPGIEKHNNYEVNYDIRYTSETSDFNLAGENILTEVSYDISPESQYVSFDTGSNPLINNFVKSRTSKIYFRSITSNTEEF